MEINGREALQLTKREMEILQLVAKGFTNKQVADRLFISMETVKKHLVNIYKKLNANNRLKALKKAGII
jgi:DNA-binding NarL/FixJ family response regulator